jgi:transcriptional regulator with XRE-family HTH domain
MKVLPPSSFGTLLKTLRERKRLTLTRVAAALSVSVVYYREVERGTRRPFSSIKVDFDILATILGGKPGDLQGAAALERGQLEFDFRGADQETHKLAVLFARCLAKRRLGKATLVKIRRLLEQAS